MNATDPTFWLISRSAGMVAYVLIGLTVVMGLALRTRLFRRLSAASVAEVHKVLAVAGLGALAVHGGALLLDEAVTFRLADILVPGLSPYRPLWVGVGVVAGWIALLVTGSFWVRRWIGARAWRRIHLLAFAAFAGATVHGLAAGTDSGRPWALGLYVAFTGLVVGLTTWRALTARRPRRAAPRAPAPGGAATARTTTTTTGAAASPAAAGR